MTALAIDGLKNFEFAWNSIEWDAMRNNVNRLQARIVKAVQVCRTFQTQTAGFSKELYQCLSRVQGNSRVRFLGSLGLVTAQWHSFKSK